jgi:predicted glutamine amidotransferase
MLIAVGEFNLSNILDDLSFISQGKNELNEKNTKFGEFTHGEGWGIAYFKKTRWHLYKSDLAIYTDPMRDELKNIKCKAVVIHARRRTIGDKSIENIQPLKFSNKSQDYIFAHNGTIFDDITQYHKYIKGNSDSVKMFNNIIHAYSHNNNNETFRVKKYTAVNFILVTKKHVQVAQKYKMNPKYSTMKSLKTNNLLIISSEILPSLKSQKWTKLKNNSMLEFDL